MSVGCSSGVHVPVLAHVDVGCPAPTVDLVLSVHVGIPGREKTEDHWTFRTAQAAGGGWLNGD